MPSRGVHSAEVCSKRTESLAACIFSSKIALEGGSGAGGGGNSAEMQLVQNLI